MKKTYEKPEICITKWNTSDIITTSGTISILTNSPSLGDENYSVRIGYKELFPEK